MIQETQKLTLDDPELNLRERNAETRDMIEKVSDNNNDAGATPNH